jgi:hypothetical protein
MSALLLPILVLRQLLDSIQAASNGFYRLRGVRYFLDNDYCLDFTGAVQCSVSVLCMGLLYFVGTGFAYSKMMRCKSESDIFGVIPLLLFCTAAIYR